MACFGLKGIFSKDTSKTVPSSVKDPFVDSDLVAGLDRENFQAYLKSRDVALIMFYDPADIQSEWTSKHFRRAAEVTTRSSHTYAAVNCDKNTDFCVSEGVPHIPHFKIYSRGEKVTYNVDARKLRYQDMKQWVETVPVKPHQGAGDHAAKKRDSSKAPAK